MSIIKRNEVNSDKCTLTLFLFHVAGGKFGERTRRSQTVFVKDYGELMQIIQDETIIVNSILPLNDDCLQVNCIPVADTDECLPSTSLVHAAFTTAHGRLVLYNALNTVGERALYHDTGKICKY